MFMQLLVDVCGVIGGRALPANCGADACC